MPNQNECVETAPLVLCLNSVLAVAESMLEEVQVEARFCEQQQDTLLCLAKRDALGELISRLREGRRDPRWARSRPELRIGL